MESIKNVVEEALNGFFTPVVVSDIATKISDKADERQLILMEKRFCAWNSFKNKKPDVWLDDGNGELIDFAVIRVGSRKSQMAHYDGTYFFTLRDTRKIIIADVTYWVQMPIFFKLW
ncbi:MAG: hypothetical protein J6D26_04145 [Clostridia bacterium]|nr:hypothetical protein [Clostridia bacterium]